MLNLLPPSVAEALEKADRKQLELAGIGSFAQVIKGADTGFVIKKSLDHPVVGNLQATTKRIYERLGHYPLSLRYYGEYRSCKGDNNNNNNNNSGLPDGLVCQYHRAGTLVDNLALSNTKYPPEKRAKLVERGSFFSRSLFLTDFGFI